MTPIPQPCYYWFGMTKLFNTFRSYPRLPRTTGNETQLEVDTINEEKGVDVKTNFETLIEAVKACTICAAHLPLGPRPVFQIHPKARILVAGQAPGRKVHETGIPFNDPSGDRLRNWMGIGRDIFYDPQTIAILPMGFCFPGTGKSGDLPPRPECAVEWRAQLLVQLQNIQLILVIGKYAQDWHLGNQQKSNLTKTVQNWREYWPTWLPLPHPSPRNNIWLTKNPWFEKTVVPNLQKRITEILSES